MFLCMVDSFCIAFGEYWCVIDCFPPSRSQGGDPTKLHFLYSSVRLSLSWTTVDAHQAVILKLSPGSCWNNKKHLSDFSIFKKCGFFGRQIV